MFWLRNKIIFCYDLDQFRHPLCQTKVFAQLIAKGLMVSSYGSEDSDQTWQNPFLIESLLVIHVPLFLSYHWLHHSFYSCN